MNKNQDLLITNQQMQERNRELTDEDMLDMWSPIVKAKALERVRHVITNCKSQGP